MNRFIGWLDNAPALNAKKSSQTREVMAAKAMMLFRHTRTGVLMNNHVRAGKFLPQCLFDSVGHLMRLYQRQMVIHLQMQLDKTCRA